jgi:hypothetical protein
MYSPEDVRTSQIDTLLTCMNYSCVYPREVNVNENLPGPKALAGKTVSMVFSFRKNIINNLNLFPLTAYVMSYSLKT